MKYPSKRKKREAEYLKRKAKRKEKVERQQRINAQDCSIEEMVLLMGGFKLR